MTPEQSARLTELRAADQAARAAYRAARAILDEQSNRVFDLRKALQVEQDALLRARGTAGRLKGDLLAAEHAYETFRTECHGKSEARR